MMLRSGAFAGARTTCMLKSICMRPKPKPPSPASVAIIDADCGCSVAALMSWCHTAAGGKRGSAAGATDSATSVTVIDSVCAVDPLPSLTDTTI